jgi:hypothetical protein
MAFWTDYRLAGDFERIYIGMATTQELTRSQNFSAMSQNASLKTFSNKTTAAEFTSMRIP